MKTFFLSLVFFCQFSASAQVEHTRQDILNANEIIFFGYDFNHFSLADPRYINKPRANEYFFAWRNYWNKLKDEKYLERQLKKKNVVFDFDYTNSIMRNWEYDSVIFMACRYLPKDSLQGIINGYNLKRKEGIGFVVLVECFEKSSKLSSGYFVFFNIADKKIIMANYLKSKDVGGTGLTAYWGCGFNETFRRYLEDVYPIEIKAK